MPSVCSVSFIKVSYNFLSNHKLYNYKMWYKCSSESCPYLPSFFHSDILVKSFNNSYCKHNSITDFYKTRFLKVFS